MENFELTDEQRVAARLDLNKHSEARGETRPTSAKNYSGSAAVAGMAGTYGSSPEHEHMVRGAAHHREQAQKLEAGANFLRSHPEFAEFIRLLRNGSISI